MRLAEATYLMGLGRFPEAEKIALSCLKRDKRNPEILLFLARLYSEMGRLNDCANMLARAQALKPKDADLAYNLGVALTMSGQTDQAIQAYQKVLALAPDHHQARLNLAACFMSLGRFQEAVAELHDLRAKCPTSRDVHLNYISALLECGDGTGALNALSQSDFLQIDDLDVCLMRARSLNLQRDYRAAQKTFEHVLARQPHSLDALNGLGKTFLNLGQPHEALMSFQKAIASAPQVMEAHHNLGSAYHFSGEFEQALKAYQRAHDLSPQSGDPLYNQALTLLLLGRFPEGFQLYEARKRLSRDARGVNRTGIPDLLRLHQAKGRRVLVDWEQGLGDSIQFCRFAPLLVEAGAKVTLRVQPQLRELIATCDPRVTILHGPIDPRQFDFHIQTMSLPLLFGTEIDSIPAQQAYLSACPARIEKWRQRISDHGLRIGISWQGNAKAQIDIGRSFSIGEFLPLTKIPHARLISLQKNEGSEELIATRDQIPVETLGSDFDEGGQAFLDSAGVMASLDLVITSDTALAHLAGALGVPCWVALQHVPDWRWLLNRADTPWYQSVRLFRQTSPRDWRGVFEKMASELVFWSRERRG